MSNSGITEVEGEIITQVWDAGNIFLSFVISFTGSYSTLQLMEQWREESEKWRKLMILCVAAHALGGCAIWAMHFTGMTALQLVISDGTILPMDFEVGYTILSFVSAVVGVFGGLYIASRDPIYAIIETEHRKSLIAQKMKNIKMSTIVNKEAVGKKIKFVALFSRLHYTVLGGALAAFGVLSMHYLGMFAQRSHIKMELDHLFIGLSTVIALVAASAAFWIIFRVLTFFPYNNKLRVASGVIMGLAVCGTHYCGMVAATYKYTVENTTDTSSIVMNGQRAASVASHTSLVVSYLFVSFIVLGAAREREQRSSTHGSGPKGNSGSNFKGVYPGTNSSKVSPRKVKVAPLTIEE